MARLDDGSSLVGSRADCAHIDIECTGGKMLTLNGRKTNPPLDNDKASKVKSALS